MAKELITIKDLVEAAGPRTIKKLRDAVQPPGKKGTWLRFCDNNQLAEIYFRLKKGTPGLQIVKTAQKQWKIKPKSSPKSLLRGVIKFKNDVVGEIERGDPTWDKESKALTDSLMKRGKKISEKLDGLEELAWLIQTQKDRLQAVIEREHKISVPFAFTDKTVETLNKLIDSFLSWQVKLGLIDETPSEVHLKWQNSFSGLMEHTVKSDGQKLANMTNRVIKALDQKALTFIKDEEGRYKLPEPEVKESADGDSNSTG
jgi:hypothetical protein